MARKTRRSSRRAPRPSRGVLIGILILVLAAAILIARQRAGFNPTAPVKETPGVASSDGVAEPPAERIPRLDSGWDRLRLRVHAEFLRLLKPGDPAALYRLTSRTLRASLAEIGVARERIYERRGAEAAAGSGRASVQWRIQVPPRASLFRINDALTQAIRILGGDVIRGVERPAEKMGLALELRVGYRGHVTHAIVVEPNPDLVDFDTEIALVVVDLDPRSQSLKEALVKSRIPLSFALRHDAKGAGRLARDLRNGGRDVLLHLPMEPRGYPRIDPGKDAILLDLSRVEIEDRIRRGLAGVGPVAGVMSRMGSAAVNDPDVMRAVLGELKRRDLPFVDAHGDGPSVAEDIGEELGARTLTLSGTLDVSPLTPKALRARLKEISDRALQRGALVVSFRANEATLAALEAEEAKWRERGIEIVAASRLAL